MGHLIQSCTNEARHIIEWRRQQCRIQRPKRILYTAIDADASGAYWAWVRQWGPAGEPAVFEAACTGEERLDLKLRNIAVLELDLELAPLDRGATLEVAVDGERIGQLSAPLPTRLFVSKGDGTWLLTHQAPVSPGFRLHGGGGVASLYHGEPLMVVWGTRGTAQARAQMRTMAEDIRANYGPRWFIKADVEDEGLFSPGSTQTGDFTVNYLFPGKADVEVTRKDMEQYNLILLGTAAENRLVEQMAGDLPVALDDGRITCSDGISWEAVGGLLLLLHYNPQAQQRLIYWLAAETADKYQVGDHLDAWHAGVEDLMAPSPDFSILAEKHYVARRFDSHWRWEAGYPDWPTLGEDGAIMKIEALLAATQADALLMQDICELRLWKTAQITWGDIFATAYYDRLAVAQLSGEQLLHYAGRIKEDFSAYPPPSPLLDKAAAVYPSPSDIDPARTYRVVMVGQTVWHYASNAMYNPEDIRILPINLRDALAAWLPRLIKE